MFQASAHRFTSGGATLQPTKRLQLTEAPGLPINVTVASAYRAYAAVTGNKNFRGEAMPEFAALPATIKSAWEAAVRQAILCATTSATGSPPDETQWEGFKSEHADHTESVLDHVVKTGELPKEPFIPPLPERRREESTPPPPPPPDEPKQSQ